MIFKISLYCDPGNDAVLRDAPTHCVNCEPSETVAVMIVNWNAGELLGKSVVSLKSQRYRIDEMIVVDNASTDSSTQDLDKLLPGIKIIHLGKNMGFAAANNVAARAVKSSKWLALTRYGGGFF